MKFSVVVNMARFDTSKTMDVVSAEALDLVKIADQGGFDIVWTAEHHTIELELLDGPFETFTGRWQFQQLGDMACKVSLDLEFRFNNSLLGAAAGKLFDSVTSNLVDSVSRRAKVIYG